MRRRTTLVSALLAAGALVVAGCESMALAPVGKGPAMFVPEEDERRLWNRAREEQERLRRGGVEYQDPALREYLNEVAQGLIPDEARRAGLRIEIRIIKNPALNAFAFPDGVIYLHTGLLARMDNEAQLATLLAHEITHVTHRHLVLRWRDLKNKTAAAATFGVISAPFGVYGALAQLLGALGTVAAISGYSQEVEAEADREGLQMMVRAGYDPREAPKLFLHLKQWVEDEKKPEPFFFNTHPRLAERVESYEAALTQELAGLKDRTDLRLGEPEFQARTRLLVLDNSLLDLQAGRFLQAQKGVGKFLALNPEDARAHYYLAETYRRQNEPKHREAAVRLYREAMALDPDYAEPHRGLGSLYYQAGQLSQAREAFERYLALAPRAPDRGYIESLLEEAKK